MAYTLQGKKLVLVIMGAFMPLVLFSQSPRWIYRYNGPANRSDFGFAIAYGSDGNIYVGGASRPGPSQDYTIISLTSSGQERWIWTYDYSSYGDERFESIVQGSDGNIYACGGKSTFIVVSLTSEGAMRWIYTYGTGGIACGAHSLVYGPDGNLYVAGLSNPDEQFTVISLDTSGNERWVYKKGLLDGYDFANSLLYSEDGNLYIAGKITQGTYPNPYHGFAVVSLTTSGAERWIYQYDPPSNWGGTANSITQGLDGNLYICGKTMRTDESYNALTTVSLNTLGAERWVYHYNPSAYEDEEGYTIIYGLDSNLYIAGFKEEYSEPVFLTLSLTSSGGERWVYLGGWDRARSIVYGLDGNIYVSGTDDGYFAIVSLTTSGAERWLYTLPHGFGWYGNEARSITYDSAGNLYAAGFNHWEAAGSNYDIAVVSLRGWVSVNENYVAKKELPFFVLPFFKDRIILKLSEFLKEPVKIVLYNISGQKVFEGVYPGDYSITISDKRIQKLGSGVYFLSVYSGKRNLGQVKLIHPVR